MRLLTPLFLLAVAAVSPDVQAATVTRSMPVCAGIRVTAPGLKVQPRDLVFSSREVLDLQFQSVLRQDLQGDHLMRFRVHTPGGFLYQEIAVPFTGSAAPRDEAERAARARLGAAARALEPSPARRIPGYPRPLPVQRLVPVAGDTWTRTEFCVTTRLPVAGTSIALGGLFGKWTVQAYLDDQKASCGPAARFTIRN
jgi:hypothetical protein